MGSLLRSPISLRVFKAGKRSGLLVVLVRGSQVSQPYYLDLLKSVKDELSSMVLT